MTDRRMTDREAIRRLASMVAVLSGRVVCWEVEERAAALENELLAEPAAPTVTREQAERIRACVGVMVRDSFDIEQPDAPAWPAFFRAVADALEGE